MAQCGTLWPMDIQGTTPLQELVAQLESHLGRLTDHALMDRIALERATGNTFGLLAEACRHELAKRTLAGA